MQINVSQQLKEPVGSTRNYEVSDIIDIDGDGTSMVQGAVTLIRTDRGILARGSLNTAIEIACSRCLSLYHCPLSINIEEEYFPVTDVTSGSTMPLPEEHGGFIIDEHHILDLSEAIRQNLLLAVPIKPLCRQDCAGLCPECGHNRNYGPCGCPRDDMDPRWAGLIQAASFGDTSISKKKGKRLE